jgi:transcriptional regulator with XRE-family HTH domain
MGNPRPKPERLAEKLLQIRNALGLSQTQMLRQMGLEDVISYPKISSYESGDREPSLIVLLQYARVAGVHVEALIDDELDLPKKLPGPVKQEEIKRQYTSRRKSKR